TATSRGSDATSLGRHQRRSQSSCTSWSTRAFLPTRQHNSDRHVFWSPRDFTDEPNFGVDDRKLANAGSRSARYNWREASICCVPYCKVARRSGNQTLNESCSTRRSLCSGVQRHSVNLDCAECRNGRGSPQDDSAERLAKRSSRDRSVVDRQRKLRGGVRV